MNGEIVILCPECGEPCTYEKGYPQTLHEPEEQPNLYCENGDCGWECEDGDIESYLPGRED